MQIKKLLAVLLAFAMVLCACNVLVLAEGDNTIVIGPGTNLDDLQDLINNSDGPINVELGGDWNLSAVAYIGETPYETLAAAVAAAKDGDTIKLMAGTFEPIDFNGKDINLVGTVADDGTLLTVFEGGSPALTMHNVNGTVKDIKIVDAWQGVYAEPAGNITFDNVDIIDCTYGLLLVAYSNDVVWNVQNCEMDLTWANSFGIYNADGATVNIKNNVFKATNPYYGGDAEVYPVNSYSKNAVTIEDNVFGKNARITFDTEDAAKSAVIGANYYADGYENAFAEGDVGAEITTYYTDYTIGEDGNIVFGNEVEITPATPDVPTATVEDIKVDHLTFAKKFTANIPEDAAAEYYGDWFADFVITLNCDATFNANGGADGYLSGQYDGYELEGYDPSKWVNVPFDGPVTIKAGEPFRIMDYAADYFKKESLNITYKDVIERINEFNCGIFFSAEYLEAHPELTVEIELNIYEPENPEVPVTIGEAITYDKDDMPTYVATVVNEAGYNQGYETLQGAINAANGKVVTILDDIALESGVTVAAGNTVTIDLNGKTIACATEKAGTTAVITNNGTLTVKDSSGAQTGKITSSALNPDTASIPSYANNTITNAGHFILESGTIENTTTSGSACYAIDLAWSTSETSVTINGGKVVGVKPAVRLVVWNANAPVNFTMTGGEIAGSYGIWIHLPGGANEVKNLSVDISGGTITALNDTYNLAIYSYSFGDAFSGVDIDISGGTFNGSIAMGGYAANNIGSGAESLDITGGTFNGIYGVFTYNPNAEDIDIAGGTFVVKPDDEYITEGFAATKNTDGTYGVEVATYVAEVDGVKYTDLQSAINAANGKTVTIISDIDLGDSTVNIPAGINVTLDLNGNTISGVCNKNSASMIIVENTATLTIKDSSANETGKITYAAGTSNVGFELDVKGNLILESGTIELTGSWSLGFAVDVRPNAWGTAYTESTTFVMNGGKIISSDTAVRVASNSSDTYAPLGVSFTMNGGVIESDWDAIFIQHLYANDISVVVNDGTVSGKNSPLRIYGENAVSDIDIQINNGTFKYTGGDTTGWDVKNVLKGSESIVADATISISGGTFDGDVSKYCADGFTCEANGDGTYGVEEGSDIFGVIFNIVNKPTKTVNGVEYYQVGFYSGIDSLRYQKVGFEIYCDGQTISVTETKTVYSSVTVMTSSGKNVTITAEQYGAYRLFGINALFPEKYNNKVIEFRVYAVDLQGNTIYSKLCSISDIYEGK